MGRRDRWPLAVIFGALLAWSLYAYLTVRVDSDIVAEAIAVQRWLANPTFLIAYPGQIHGGVLEYPIIALAESIAPGNAYAFTFVRIFYVPITALLIALTVRRVLPTVSLWPFAAAAVAGPAVLHGFLAIKDLYPSSWLISALGVWLLARTLDGSRSRALIVVSGVLLGLGVYQHPTAALLGVPFLAVLLVRWWPGVRGFLLLIVGGLIGLLPLIVSFLTSSSRTLVFTPARAGLPDLLGAFGVSLADDAWARSLVQAGWGFSFTDITVFRLPVVIQGLLGLLLLVGCVAALVLAVRLIVTGAGVESPLGLLAVLWGAGLLIVIALMVVVPPVFFYGGALAFGVMASIAALWSVASHRADLLGRGVRVVVVVVVALMAATSAGAYFGAEPNGPTAVWFKDQKAQEMSAIADAIEAANIEYLFGDYWEVLPVVHTSGGDVIALTPVTNRFGVPGDWQGLESVRIAVSDGRIALPIGLGQWNTAPNWVNLMAQSCEAVTEVALPEGVGAYDCPVDVLVEELTKY